MSYYQDLLDEAASRIDQKRFLEGFLEKLVEREIKLEKRNVYRSNYEGMEYYREYVHLKLQAHKLRKWMDGDYGDDFEQNYRLYRNYHELTEKSKKCRAKALEILKSA